MRLAILSVLMVVAGVGSASAQYGDDSYELHRIARSLDNIDWELFRQGLWRDTAPSGGYGGGYGYSVPTETPPVVKKLTYKERKAALKERNAKRVHQPRIRMYTYYSNGPLWMW